jgi:CRISPR-associated protein Csb1
MLTNLITGPYAAIRLIQRLQPVAGAASKVFPPTFEGGVYCYEHRRINGETKRCVLLDSVASAANRQEEALADLVARGAIELPRLITDFSAVPALGDVSTLEAPHRVFDAIFRDSELNGQRFDKSALYLALSQANPSNATKLFEHTPTSLLFGSWDSTGSAGGLGNKFPRRVVTELIGVGVEHGENRGGVRVDPMAISSKVDIEVDKNGDWRAKGVVEPKDGEKRAKGTRPSELNHGNVLAKVETGFSSRYVDDDLKEFRHTLKGGVTCDYIEQQSVVSLSGLRRLKFPINGKSTPAVDDAAREVLAALALVALSASRDQGYALRSRCDLVCEGLAEFESIRHDGSSERFAMTTADALTHYASAVKRARAAGLPWAPEPITLKPQAKLVKLIELSRLAGAGGD